MWKNLECGNIGILHKSEGKNGKRPWGQFVIKGNLRD